MKSRAEAKIGSLDKENSKDPQFEESNVIGFGVQKPHKQISGPKETFELTIDSPQKPNQNRKKAQP